MQKLINIRSSDQSLSNPVVSQSLRSLAFLSTHPSPSIWSKGKYERIKTIGIEPTSSHAQHMEAIRETSERGSGHQPLLWTVVSPRERTPCS